MSLEIVKLYTYKEAREYLIEKNFIYKIPNLENKEDKYFYLIYFSKEDNEVTYATLSPTTGCLSDMHLIFYDKSKMTESIFGVRRDRFSIDPELLALKNFKMINKKEKSKAKWKGEDFTKYLNRDSFGLFNQIKFGSLYVSIQGSEFCSSTPKKKLKNASDYEKFEIVFFNRTSPICTKDIMDKILCNYERRFELYAKTDDFLIYEYVDKELIQDMLNYLLKNKPKRNSLLND